MEDSVFLFFLSSPLFSHFGETSDYGRYCHDMNDERERQTDSRSLRDRDEGKKGPSCLGFC